MLCYQRPAAGLAHASAESNRSHEYAPIFQNSRARPDLEQAAQLLQA
ncbi:hypothetical protein AZ54_04165 [Xanthomonas oryzae pv. oryzae PXO86]|uniref:Uncharacterized protein n=1 Tax=Xanthomonas oryzae pv. oryzae (strain PXO99A) TaxID=360094 RepID=A0A0K0GHC3_XANOP|nr:hypothetical protein PXO_04296 [Xanthomonas oryzae pv. oryzae PXO99A]AJQ85403.1 hypothetical protein AZ54_04165 [Xanthomonas oryzae pv. oryzae PXO86]